MQGTCFGNINTCYIYKQMQSQSQTTTFEYWHICKPNFINLVTCTCMFVRMVVSVDIGLGTHTQTKTQIKTQTQTHTHTYKHKHTHTHTHTRRDTQAWELFFSYRSLGKSLMWQVERHIVIKSYPSMSNHRGIEVPWKGYSDQKRICCQLETQFPSAGWTEVDKINASRHIDIIQFISSLLTMHIAFFLLDTFQHWAERTINVQFNRSVNSHKFHWSPCCRSNNMKSLTRNDLCTQDVGHDHIPSSLLLDNIY